MRWEGLGGVCTSTLHRDDNSLGNVSSLWTNPHPHNIPDLSRILHFQSIPRYPWLPEFWPCNVHAICPQNLSLMAISFFWKCMRWDKKQTIITWRWYHNYWVGWGQGGINCESMKYSWRECAWRFGCSWCAHQPGMKRSHEMRFEERKEPLSWTDCWWSFPLAPTSGSWQRIQHTQKHRGSVSVQQGPIIDFFRGTIVVWNLIEMWFTDQLPDFCLATLSVCVQDELQPRGSLKEVEPSATY